MTKGVSLKKVALELKKESVSLSAWHACYLLANIKLHLKCLCVVSRCYCPYRWQIKVQVLGCLAH